MASTANNVEQLQIHSNNETFTRGSYNGISVLIRDKDKYINATAMCNQFNKKFRKIFENISWQHYLKEFEEEYQTAGIPADYKYELKKGFSFEIRGTYIHPKLINYVAIWASPRYAVKVGKIMDAINDNNTEALNVEIGKLKNVIVEQKLELEEKDLKLEEKDLIIEEEKQLNEQKDQVIANREQIIQHEKQIIQVKNSVIRAKNERAYDNDVRVDMNCQKVKIVKDEEEILVSCDQKNRKSGKIIKTYWFPAGMNIRQAVKQRFKKKGSTPRFPEEQLPELKDYLESLGPK